jgi:hypothetical protein
MTKKSKAPETPPELKKRVLFTPHRIALITMWLITTVSLVVMLFSGVRNADQFRTERYILQVAYVLALFWYLIRTGSSVKQLPDLSPLILPKLRVGKLIPVIVIALLLVAEFSGQGIVFLLLMLATIWIECNLFTFSFLAKIRSICTAKFQSIFHIPNLHCSSHRDILCPQNSFG